MIKDSAIVAIVQKVSYRSEPGQPVTVAYPVIYFTLIDLPTKTFYNFGSFSDTASIIEAYRPDSTGAAKGGWYIFMRHTQLYRGNKLALADTTILGRRFKRIKGSRTITIPDDELYTPDEIVMYMDCSSDGRILHHPNSISEEGECPVVMVESFRNGKPINYNIFDYSREPLTREQSRVLDAWLARVRRK
ncbi:MAG: hypothetical protein EOP56_19635 [Sphingobacteriales bacterium]|nr:MAG: hypothetical protein EOP56_19635 [Sphingobacteriales bacterium]